MIWANAPTTTVKKSVYAQKYEITAEISVTTPTATYGEPVRGDTFASASGAIRSIDQPNMQRVMISSDIGTVGTSHEPKPTRIRTPRIVLPDDPAATSMYVGLPPRPIAAGSVEA